MKANVIVHTGPRSKPIGSQRHAVIVAEGTREEKKAAGLRYLDSGAFKDAYVSAQGYVYKVGNVGDCYGHGVSYEDGDEVEVECDCLEQAQNAIWKEFTKASELAEQGYTWVAPTSLYEVNYVPVMVQRLYTLAGYDGVSSRRQRAYVREAQDILADVYSNNYGLTKRGLVRVFDLGGHEL